MSHLCKIDLTLYQYNKLQKVIFKYCYCAKLVVKQGRKAMGLKSKIARLLLYIPLCITPPLSNS
jgi:hypothetical protein